jgi:kinesin family member 1
MQKVTYQTKDGKIKTVTKAELQDQMETHEKLINSLNETWEEKMIRTQEVQKEREKALEELGITVEKNLVGVHTPKKVRGIGYAGWVMVLIVGCRIDTSFGEPGMLYC